MVIFTHMHIGIHTRNIQLQAYYLATHRMINVYGTINFLGSISQLTHRLKILATDTTTVRMVLSKPTSHYARKETSRQIVIIITQNQKIVCELSQPDPNG